MRRRRYEVSEMFALLRAAWAPIDPGFTGCPGSEKTRLP